MPMDTNNSPRAGAKNLKSAAEKEPSRGEETEQDEPRDADQDGTPRAAGGRDRERARSGEGVRLSECTLRHLSSPGSREGSCRPWPMISRSTGSGTPSCSTRTVQFLMASTACVPVRWPVASPGLITWEGKPGEEVAYVISQNLARRHLNESQRGMIASQTSGFAQRSTPGRQICRGAYAG